MRDREGLLEVLVEEIEQFIRAKREDGSLKQSIAALETALNCVVEASVWLKSAAQLDANEIGAASVPYLRLMTLALYAFMWTRMESAAHEGLANNIGNTRFYEAKLKTASFFRARIMPSAAALVAEIKGGSGSLMAMDADQF